jgi:hypothetical protein
MSNYSDSIADTITLEKLVAIMLSITLNCSNYLAALIFSLMINFRVHCEVPLRNISRTEELYGISSNEQSLTH